MAKLYKLFLLFLFIALISRNAADDDIDDNDEASDSDGDSDEVRIEDSVLVLTEKNFDDVVSQHPTILVEFYAPWCGHCKSLAPEYSAAAEELAKNSPPVALGKVDSTVHSDLAQRFSVQGYPTLRFFKDGKDYEYDGPRQKDGIVQYMKARASPDWEPEPEAVMTLTKDDFDEVVDNEELMLVEFYAPWCGHCKRMAPAYEKAAKQLKKQDPPIILAKVDATQESDLASKFGVTGYPTLKVFRNGKPADYKGHRESEYDFVSYMINQVGDGAKEVKNQKAMKEFLQVDDVTIVGFFDSPDSPKRAPYKQVSDEDREDFKFGIVYDDAVRKNYKINPNSVVIFHAERFYTKYEPKWQVLEIKDDTTADDVRKFIEEKNLPLVGYYGGPMKSRYDKRRPLCIVFYSVDFGFDYREATQLWRKKIAAVAKQYPDMIFAVADDEANANLMAEFGLDESGEEMNIGIFGADNKKYGMEPMEEYDSDEIIEFLNKYKKGKLQPHIKSQRPPKKQTGPVTVVVGKTFNKIVLDPKKDVLLELYAPWCGHCKNLEPIYASLAKKLKKEKNLVIAKMDATANDAPDNFKASGFPTIYYVSAKNKDSPVVFDGARDVEGFEKFLREHATVSFGKGGKDEL